MPLLMPWRSRQQLITCIGAIVAWLCLMTLPTHGVPGEGEASWSAVLNHAAIHHLQFGVELIFTYGPLGFLSLSSFSHTTWGWVLLFQAVSRAIYLVIIYSIASRTYDVHRVPFVISAILFPMFNSDVFYLLLITLVAILFVAELPRLPLGLKWIGLGLMVLVGLIKFTYLCYAVAAVICVTAYLVSDGRWTTGLAVCAGWATTFAISWSLVAHQRLENLVRWFASSSEVASAYQLSQSLPPTRNLLLYALALWLILLGTVIAKLRKGRGSVAIAFLFLAGAFVAWKQGFTRFDTAHYPTFFLYVGVALSTIPMVARVPSGNWMLFVAFVCLGWGSTGKTEFPLSRLITNTRFLCSRSEQRQEAARNVKAYDLPAIRAIVKDSTVDVLGRAQGIALLNGLNYKPAPVFLTYCASSPPLVDVNTDYYSSVNGPEYVIYKPATIDNRFETFDLSRVGLIVTTQYEKVCDERGYTLYHRTVSPHKPSLELLSSGTLASGESIPTQGASWCEVHMEENLLGRVCALLYQAPRVQVEISVAGGVAIRRFPPNMARSGFLVPENVTALAIQDNSAVRSFYRPTVAYRLYRIPRVTSRLPVVILPDRNGEASRDTSPSSL